MTDRSSDESSLIEKNNKLWQPAEDTLSLFQLEMFHILRATLEYPADPEVKCAKLVDDIKFFFRSEDPPYLENVYEVILEVAGCLPSGHPWQDSLVGSVDSLRKGGGTILENGKVRDARSPVFSTGNWANILSIFSGVHGRIFLACASTCWTLGSVLNLHFYLFL